MSTSAVSLSEPIVPSLKGGGDSPKPHAVVIGSGFGGLSAAIRLQSSGFQVTLLEKLEKAGGRASRWRQDGYTFDMGPSLITAPGTLRRVFAAAGKKLDDYLKLIHLDPYYRVFFHDKTLIDYCGDRDKMMSQMARFNERDAERYDDFIDAIRPIHAAVMEDGLGATPFHKPSTMARFLPTIFRLKAFLPATVFVNRFFRDFRHRFLFSFHPLYIGGNPFRVPAIYLLIPYLERNEGVWYTPGGMYSVIEALQKVFLEKGGRLLTGKPVTRIEVHQRRATAVVAGDETYPCDLVVSNADVGHTYRHLIDPVHRKKWTEPRIDRLDYTMSCFLLFLGCKKRFSEIKHHTLILTERYRALLQDIFTKKILPDDFSMYVHAPSITDPSMAPEGCESLMVLIPVANQLSSIDWEKKKEGFADKVIDFLEDWGMEGLKESLEVKRIFTPVDFESRYFALHGNAFALVPRLSQTGYFRPHNRSEDVKNLYLVGAGTHPGAGVPGVLLSAEAAMQCIHEDFPAVKKAGGLRTV